LNDIDTPAMRMKTTPLFIIFLIVFIDLLGFGIVIPILPLYALNDFKASELTVGLLVASFSFMQLLFTPLWGRMSDRFGRKPILIVGLLATVIGYILFGLAHSITLLFVSRLLAGIGGANISAAQAYIADITPPHERAKGMGLIGAAFGLGFVFGPVAGGLLSQYGYSVPGYAAAGLSLLALLLTATLLPESRKDTSAVPETRAPMSVKRLLDVISQPRIGALLALFFLCTFGYANIYATFPMISTGDFGYTNHEVGYLFGFMGLIGAVTQGGLIRILSNRVAERVLFIAGAACTMAGLALIPFHGNTVGLHLVLTVLSLGTGVITPTLLSMISRFADREEQGAVLGVNQSLGSLGRVLGPLWGTFVYQAFGHPWPFLTGGIVMFLVLIIAWRSV
jgi:MFS transporter, DHA1 family, tetracycline resistance protein